MCEKGDLLMDKRILTVQDISCVGQCSLTVALPVISAFGLETAILPTAVLSNHTAGYGGWTFCDLTDQMTPVRERWLKEGVDFDCIYTGYLGSVLQIDEIIKIADDCMRHGGKLIVDPVMADNGVLYKGFDMNFVEQMKRLVSRADVILPNITEACLLTGIEYREAPYSREYVESILDGLTALGAKDVVLTGVCFDVSKLGVAVRSNGQTEYRFERYVDKRSHGTGDIFASVFTGAYMCGDSLADAAQFGARVVIESILQTMDDADHWYGVKFEKALPMITNYKK